jgi:hypothetical protein
LSSLLATALSQWREYSWRGCVAVPFQSGVHEAHPPVSGPIGSSTYALQLCASLHGSCATCASPLCPFTDRLAPCAVLLCCCTPMALPSPLPVQASTSHWTRTLHTSCTWCSPWAVGHTRSLLPNTGGHRLMHQVLCRTSSRQRVVPACRKPS